MVNERELIIKNILKLKNLILNSEIEIDRASEIISMFILAENIINLKKLCSISKNIELKHFTKFRNSLAHLKTMDFDSILVEYRECIKELRKETFEENILEVRYKSQARRITDDERLKIIESIGDHFMDKYGKMPEFWKIINSPVVDNFIDEYNYIVLDSKYYDMDDIDKIINSTSKVVGFLVNARLLKKVENIPNEKSKNGISEFSWE